MGRSGHRPDNWARHQNRGGARRRRARTLTVLIEQDEDGYFFATVPALRSCYTQAKSLATLHKRILEVIKLCLAHE